MDIAQLKEKGGIYIENIQRGLKEYASESVHLGERQAYQCLKEEWDKCGSDQCYADFYYFYLDKEAREKVREYLTEDEISYVERLNREEIIFPMDDILLRIIVKLNAKEILFSTVYFLGDASTWWGNYKEEYIVFKNSKRHIYE